MTTFELSVIEGVLGRGGSAIGVKERYAMRIPSEPEPTEIKEAPEEVNEEIPSDAEVPAEEPESQPESEPEMVPEPEPELEEVVEPVVEEAVEEEIVEEAVEPEAEVVEETVEPVVEEEPVEEAPLQITDVKFVFDPPSPFFGDKVRLKGYIEGLGSDPNYYLSVKRLVDGNGTQPVGEVGLTVEGDRIKAVAQIRNIPQVPLLVSQNTLRAHLSQVLH